MNRRKSHRLDYIFVDENTHEPGSIWRDSRFHPANPLWVDVEPRNTRWDDFVKPEYQRLMDEIELANRQEGKHRRGDAPTPISSRPPSPTKKSSFSHPSSPTYPKSQSSPMKPSGGIDICKELAILRNYKRRYHTRIDVPSLTNRIMHRRVIQKHPHAKICRWTPFFIEHLATTTTNTNDHTSRFAVANAGLSSVTE